MEAVSQQATAAAAAPDASVTILGGTSNNVVDLQSALYTLEVIVFVSKWKASTTLSFTAIRLESPCLGARRTRACARASAARETASLDYWR